MHTGNLVFSQLMEFAPWHTFRRLVAKYRGDFNVRTFSCLDQFLSMAFAQELAGVGVRSSIKAFANYNHANLFPLSLLAALTIRPTVVKCIPKYFPIC
ncbi:MAG: DUF4372 domain-containing protein [Deltaproteobacteria bacterium]|nr:DUF4372 domain-containing protein [Deltaproteobacteria bacterium]